jgi:hypothetical protein
MNGEIDSCIERASRWLLGIQEDDGGWGAYKGHDANSLNTAEDILALIESGRHTAGDRNIQGGVQFLIKRQLNKRNCKKKSNYGAWSRDMKKAKKITHIPDIIRTCFALLALNKSGKRWDEKPLSMGISWLKNAQNEDGGWGYKTKSESKLFPTCVALRVLLSCYSSDDRDLKERITRGFDHIAKSYRNSDGSFGRQHGLELSHTLHVILTFQTARNQHFTAYSDFYEDAIYWVGNSRQRVMRWSDEMIMIGDSCNYTYSHVNPALYLAAFGDNVKKSDDIANGALVAIYDNADHSTCGFCAKRATSWATAKTIIGLARLSKTTYKDFPKLEDSAPARPKGRHFILLLLVLVVVLSAILAMIDKLSVNWTTVLFMVILAALLIYGFLSEHNFVRLFIYRFSLRKTMTKKT